MEPARNQAPSPLMELRAIGRTFEDEGGSRVDVLTDMSLAVEQGEFVCITGPSGSGKSTLLNLLGCLDRPSNGTYRFAGQDVTDLDADALADLRRDEFGYVFQAFNLVDSATARQNVELPSRYAGVDADWRRQRAQALLESLNLGERLDHRPFELSGGEQQRVAIARALMNGGRVILADEPTGALDSMQGHEVLSLLRQLSTRGHTVVIVSHDAAVAAVADRRIELRNGRLVGDSGTSVHEPLQFATERKESAGRLPGVIATVRDALVCLWASPLRAALTVLSVAVGVGSVIALLSLAEGIERTTLELISADEMTIHGYGSLKADAVRLTPADAEAIQAEVANVRRVLLSTQGPLTVQWGALGEHTQVRAESRIRPRGVDDQEWPLARGAFLSAEDNERRAQVVVLGPTVAEALFDEGIDPVGEHVQIAGVPFLVKGILEQSPLPAHVDLTEEMRSLTLESFGDVVYVPFYTGFELLTPSPGSDTFAIDGVVAFGSLSIEVRVADAAEIESTAAHIRDLLIRRHGREGFNIEIDAQRAGTYETFWRLHPVIQAVIGAVALLAAVVGVTATMLVSVGARRREIGIRMAIGARRRDIASQFLVEVAIAAIVGGALGLLLGYWTAVAGAAMATPPGWMKVPVSFATWFVPVALGVGAATGLVAGIVPALRAASLHPATALEAE